MQARPEPEIRAVRDSDRPEILELMARSLGAGSVPRSEEFWRWKHEHNPFGPSPVLVATAGGRIVGVRAYLRWRWHRGDRVDRAVRAVDTVTHPDWRQQGLFTRLTRRLTEQMIDERTAFVFNTPNRKSGRGYRKMGWEPVGRLPVYVHPRGLGRAIRRAAGRPRPSPSRGTAARFETVTAFLRCPETAGFLDRVDRQRSDHRLRTVVTPSYLRWRYGEPPGLDYRVSWGGDGDDAAALVLRARRRRGLHELSVSEILVTPGPTAASVASRLLAELLDSGWGDYVVATASPATAEHVALRQAGFWRLPAAGPRLHCRELIPDPSRADLHRLGNWRLGLGPFELF